MGKNLAVAKHTFLFCDGGSCQKAGGDNVIRQARAYLRNNELWDQVHTIKTRCNGRCEDAPTCIVLNDGSWYKNLNSEKITPLIASYIHNEENRSENLLFQKGWSEVKSDNERKKVTPKQFELKNDSDLGECYLTKGFSSDQYLFPLFQYLNEVKEGAILTLSDGVSYNLDELQTVKYEDKYKVELGFKHAIHTHFIIGFVPKTEPDSLVQQKISSTEYFSLTESNQKGIRLKNKMGETKAVIYLAPHAPQLWDYCLNIQLGGMTEPIKTNSNV
mgnify:CR=1 FL=1